MRDVLTPLALVRAQLEIALFRRTGALSWERIRVWFRSPVQLPTTTVATPCQPGL